MGNPEAAPTSPPYEGSVESNPPLESTETNEDSSVESLAMSSLKRFEERQASILTDAEKEIGDISSSLGVEQAAAAQVFREGGFGEQVQQIRSRISEITTRARERVADFLQGREKIPKIDITNERARGATERIARTLERSRSSESFHEGGLYHKEAILADEDHIENQQIDIIQSLDGNLHVSFKLTEKSYRAARDRFPTPLQEDRYGENPLRQRLARLVHEISKLSPASLTSGYRPGSIKYSQINDYGAEDSYKFDSYEKNVAGGVLRIANSSERSSRGLVEIEFIAGEISEKSPEEIHAEVARILEQEFGIENGTHQPDEEAENQYKQARYKWLHKADTLPEGIESSLVRKEVSPGYHTFVAEGQHEKLAKGTRLAIYHKLWGEEAIPNIIKAGGLLSTHERFRRGLLAHGMSSRSDMVSGGADSVFVRTITEEGLIKSDALSDTSPGRYCLIFEPRILDRTDWYAYDNDRFGSTDPKDFKKRLNPEELISEVKRDHASTNEQMFRSGIATKDIRAFAVRDIGFAEILFKNLYENGITEVDGRPLESMFMLVQDNADMIAVGNGEMPRDQAKLLAVLEKVKLSLGSREDSEEMPLAA